MKDANLAIHALYPDAITIGEDLSGWDAIVAPVDPANLDSYTSGYGFNGQWDDGFYYAVEPLLIASDDVTRDVTSLAPALTSGTSMSNVLYTENHDKVAPQNGADHQRIPALIGSSQNNYWAKRRSGLGIAMMMTTPGMPMLFMGQEFLEATPFPFDQGPALEWSNETTNAGFRTMVHDLIALRRNIAGTTAGLRGEGVQLLEAANRHGNQTSPAIAFHRWDQGGVGDDTVVAANFSNVQLALPIGFPLPGIWHVRFNSDDTSYSADFGGTPSSDVNAVGPSRDGMNQSGTVQLGPYSVVILSQ
jgi:1,4-alpha-glucan branching enzyme